jgi:hypothetical protein
MVKRGTSTWLRYIVNLWTLILFVLVVLDFLDPGAYAHDLGPVAAVYVGALVIYSAEKEFERWAEYYDGRHPGEIYVFCWTLLIALLVLASLFFNTEYTLPPEIISTYIAVISIMAFTRKSKSFFEKKGK